MKRIALAVTAVFALALCSCNEAGKLASAVEGTWSGAPVRLIDESASSAMIIDNMILTVDSTGRGGELIMSGLITTTAQLQGTQAVMQPFSMSASAKSTATGSWTAVSEDEINVNINPATIAVTVDPQAIELTANLLTGSTTPEPETLKPQLAQSIQSQLSGALQLRYAGMKHFDDVKVKGNVMKLEVNDAEYTFSRQGLAPQ
ncbi:MAG: hypothetical protein NC043_08795 [Muribaculaceae bacterium]|nr:hypothetical protein [Muribaculaceae bacterium]